MTNIRCGTCKSVLVAWNEKPTKNVAFFGKCEGCHKLWQLEIDLECNMVEATDEDIEN